MAQQPKIEFEPAFEPAGIQFEPAFEPAEPVEVKGTSESIPTGKWVTKGNYTEWQADKPVNVSKRPDKQAIGGVGTVFDSLRETGVNRVAANRFIPEAAKPYVAMATSLALEPTRFIAETLAEPEGLLFPSAVKRLPGALRRPPKVEVLPPEVAPVKLPSRQLPAGDLTDPNIPRRSFNDPYIGGDDARVQRESRLSPQEEARLAGYDIDPTLGPLGKQGDIAVNPGIDLGEFREAQRLRNIHYTRHELEGGTSLEIPDTGERYLRSTELGTNVAPRDSGSLTYPLNVVPSSVRPRQSQEVNRALAPRGMQEPVIDTPKTTLEPAPITPEIPAAPVVDNYGGTGAIKPGEDILPSAPPREKVPAHVAAQEVNPKPIESTVDNYVTKNVEPVFPGASAEVKTLLSRTKDTMRNVANGLLVSGEKQLERMGPVGTNIRQLLSSVEYTKRELYNQFAEPFINATKGLSDEEISNFVDVMDGNAVPNSPAVANAVDASRPITDAMGEMAQKAGVNIKTPTGQVVPFTPLKNYWPRRPVNPRDTSSFINELMANNKGMSRDRAEKLAKGFQENSEWFNSPQHSRTANGKFAYRKDLNAMIDHMSDMADIIARARHLGPGDIGNKSSVITSLIESSPNPSKALDLVRTHLRGGMDKNNEFYQGVKAINSLATKVQVFTKLGLFPISNLNNQLQTILHGDFKNVAEGLRRSIFDSEAIRKVAKDYGTIAVGDIPQGILSEAGKRPVPIVGGLVKWADDWSRVVATGAGQGVARTVFKAAQNGDVQSVNKLKNLLLQDDIGKVLQQNQLTPEQVKFATHRFVELAQQLESKVKIPPAWANEPLLHIPLIFKRFAFQGTKSTKDAIMSNPARNIPLFLVAAPMFGELTGDMKSAVYGAIRGVPMPDEAVNAMAFELRNRGNFAGKLTGLDSEDSDLNWLVNRITADYIQSWGLGLVGDMLQGTLGDEASGYAALLGPAVEQGVNLGQGIAQGKGTQLGREALRSMPIIGPGMQRRILPTESQELP